MQESLRQNVEFRNGRYRFSRCKVLSFKVCRYRHRASVVAPDVASVCAQGQYPLDRSGFFFVRQEQFASAHMPDTAERYFSHFDFPVGYGAVRLGLVVEGQKDLDLNL